MRRLIKHNQRDNVYAQYIEKNPTIRISRVVTLETPIMEIKIKNEWGINMKLIKPFDQQYNKRKDVMVIKTREIVVGQLIIINIKQ